MKYIKCKICNDEFTSSLIGSHIRFKHDMNSKLYYDTYMKSTNEGKCVVCGNECKFQSISNGYANTCSYKCAQFNPDTRDKIENTNLKKYGAKTPSGNAHVLAKITATNMEKYGTKAPYQNKDIKEKGINTVIKKYGVNNVFKLDDIQAKSRKTMKTKYGYELNVLRPEVKNHIKLCNRKNKFPEFIQRLKLKHITYLDTKDIYVNQNVDRTYKCNLCGKHFTESSTQAYDVQCGCLRRRSKGEHEIYNWLTSLHFNSTQTEYIYDTEGRMEIDVVVTLPTGFKLGIEYCGIYWHSELFRNNKYHKRKLDAANTNGYTLIQIFEDEWRDKKDIIKSIILQYLGNNSSVIYARKSKIEKLDKTPNKFLELNHIQGKANSSYSYGLTYNNEIVAVCTFSKNRFGNGWECIRYCNKLNTTVVGGFGKLLNQFIKDVNPSEIVSYADCRYFTGDVYLKNGFTQDKVIPVGYFYIPKGFQERLNRIKFQKHKLKNMPSYDINKTEVQIMTEEGYTRIFDAGQKVFRRELPTPR